MSIGEILKKNSAKKVKIWHTDRTFTEYLVNDPGTFNPKKGLLARFTDALPDFIERNKIQDVPPARDRRTNFSSYEFFEGSNESIDPYDRKPDFKHKELEAQQLMEAYEAGSLEERIKSKSKFNMLVLCLLVLNLIVAGAGIFYLNQQTEVLKPLAEKAHPLLDKLSVYIEEQNQTNQKDGVVGGTKNVS